MNFRNQLGQVFSSLLLFGFWGNSQGHAQEHTACFEGQLGPDDVQRAQFGFSMDRDGNWLVVGAPFDSEVLNESGAVYVFHREGEEWVQTQKLLASDAALFPGQRFGHAVSISEDFIAVSTEFVQAYVIGNPIPMSSEQVYLFQRQENQWLEQARLLPTNHSPGDHFGESLSLDGNRLLVGAPERFTVEPFLYGSAYLFQYQEGIWIEEAELRASADYYSYGFGAAVELEDSLAIVGAPLAYSISFTSSELRGRVFIFQQNASLWEQESVLLPTGVDFSDRFGAAISLDNNQLLVGAPEEYLDQSASRGAAYIFQREQGSWQQVVRLLSGNPENGFRFGVKVSLFENHAAVADSSGKYYGYPPSRNSVHVFENAGGIWNERGNIFAPSTFPNISSFSDFGQSVNLNAQELLVGDPQFLYGLSGSILSYSIAENCLQDCNSNGTDDLIEVLLGHSQDLNHNQLPDECELPFRIVYSDPSNGLIDPRQPSDSMGNINVGINGVYLQFNTAGLGMVPEEWMVSEIGGDGIAPGISYLQASSVGAVSFYLNSVLEPGTWTIFTHIPTGEAIRVGYLPGDVNGDGTSSPHDILTLLNIMLGVEPIQPGKEYYVDINRNGLLEPYDILRLIDLLLGNGVYESYFYQSLPE